MPATTPILAIPYPLGTDPVQRGDDDMKALAERVEALIDGRPRGWLTGLQLTSNSPIIGDSSWATPAASAPVLRANRRVLIMLDLVVMTNASDSGMRFTFKRWPVTGGVAGTPVNLATGPRAWTGHQVNQLNNAHFHFVDLPPAGTYAYGFQATGFLTNGGTVCTDSLITVLDVGAVGAATRPGVDVDGPGIDQELPDEQPEGRPGQELPEHPAPRGTDDDDDTDA